MLYRIRNWRNHQHYSDRNPPWIKLHFALLNSPDWIMWDDASKLLALCTMMVASRNSDGQIDGSPAGLRYLQKACHLDRKIDLKPLIDSGFLELASTALALDASTVLASKTETEKSTEKSTETEKNSSEAVKGAVNGNAVCYIPVVGAGNKEWGVSKEFLAELCAAYPAVDGEATLREIRAWCVSNPSKRKTETGMARFINSWFSREQNRGA